MPYCAKCGVELEATIKECPLCHFHIPAELEKTEEDDYLKELPFNFPKPENIYPGKLLDFKKRTFQAISAMILLNIGLLGFFHFRAGNSLFSFIYITAIAASLWLYLLLFFDFIPNRKLMIASLIGNTFLFTLLIDFADRDLDWFWPVFVPGTVWASVVLIVTASIIRLKKKRSKNIILLIAFSLSIFFVGMESIITRSVLQRVTLSWSIFIAGELLSFALLLLFFYHNIPARIKSKLKKKMHI